MANLSPTRRSIESKARSRGFEHASRPELNEPRPRNERDRPGEIIHIDIKKLGRFSRPGYRITGDRHGQSNTRGVGWEYVHVGIDDRSRVAYSDIFANEKKESAVVHLEAAVAFYKRLGVKADRVMTDNGSCYRLKVYAGDLRGHSASCNY